MFVLSLFHLTDLFLFLLDVIVSTRLYTKDSQKKNNTLAF